MKTIAITIYGGDMEKKILQSGMLAHLVAHGVRVVLLVREDLERYAAYRSEQVVVESLPRADCFSEKLYYWLGWNILPTRSTAMRRYESYLKDRSLVRYVAGSIVGFLGRFYLFREAARLVYWLIPDDYGVKILETYRPDAVFAPSMFSFEDGRLLRAAKKRGIPTVTLTKSWDVLTNKAFTRVRADLILVQNEALREVAIRLGDYAPNRVRVIGFVEFDFTARSELLVSREAFCRSIGADPSKKLILYSTSGDWKNPYDDEVVEGIHRAIVEGSLTSAQILARFHPKYPSAIERLSLPYLIKDRPGVAEGEERSIEGAAPKEYRYAFGEKDLAHLANTLYHSDVTINTMSTMTLDAIAFDKPVILVCHDGFDRMLDYWHSLRRTYEEDHYRVIMELDPPCVRIASRMQETVDAIQDYLGDPAREAPGRKRLRETYLYKLDGKSAKRMADAVFSACDAGTQRKIPVL